MYNLNKLRGQTDFTTDGVEWQLNTSTPPATDNQWARPGIKPSYHTAAWKSHDHVLPKRWKGDLPDRIML